MSGREENTKSTPKKNTSRDLKPVLLFLKKNQQKTNKPKSKIWRQNMRKSATFLSHGDSKTTWSKWFWYVFYKLSLMAVSCCSVKHCVRKQALDNSICNQHNWTVQLKSNLCNLEKINLEKESWKIKFTNCCYLNCKQVRVMKIHTNSINIAMYYNSLGFQVFSGVERSNIPQPWNSLASGPQHCSVWWQKVSLLSGHAVMQTMTELGRLLLPAEVIQYCLNRGRGWCSFTWAASSFSLQFIIHYQTNKVHSVKS